MAKSTSKALTEYQKGFGTGKQKNVIPQQPKLRSGKKYSQVISDTFFKMLMANSHAEMMTGVTNVQITFKKAFTTIQLADMAQYIEAKGIECSGVINHGITAHFKRSSITILNNSKAQSFKK